jgi:PUA domain protein
MLAKLEVSKATKELSKGQFKGIRESLTGALLPGAEVDLIFPAKEKYTSIKARAKGEAAMLITVNKEPVLCEVEGIDGNTVVPHLKVIHRFPDMLPRVTVDPGAIRFMLTGANVMVPGVVKSPDYQFPEKALVSIYCQGKLHAVALGVTLLSADQLRLAEKGVAI